jgi:hypothetical protein
VKSSAEAMDATTSPSPRRPGWAERCALALLVPAAFREEFIGDLIEELRTSRRLRDLSPRAARAWVWRQILGSAPSLVRSRLTRGGKMAKIRWLACAVFFVMGSLQAWDSRVLAAPTFVIALVACGLMLHTLGLLLASRAATTFATLIAMVVLLVAVKFASPTNLPALGVIGVIGLITSMMRSAAERRAAKAGPPNASPAS